MRLSLQVHYAICGVFDLAYNGQSEPVQVRVIGARQCIPTRYLEQIFQRLRRADLVTGKRGPGGGYTLARPAAEISVRAIVEAMEGPIGEAPEFSAEDVSAYRPDFAWPELAARLSQALDEVTIAALCQQASQAAVRRDQADSYSYQI